MRCRQGCTWSGGLADTDPGNHHRYAHEMHADVQIQGIRSSRIEAFHQALARTCAAEDA